MQNSGAARVSNAMPPTAWQLLQAPAEPAPKLAVALFSCSEATVNPIQQSTPKQYVNCCSTIPERNRLRTKSVLCAIRKRSSDHGERFMTQKTLARTPFCATTASRRREDVVRKPRFLTTMNTPITSCPKCFRDIAQRLYMMHSLCARLFFAVNAKLVPQSSPLFLP